MIQKILRFLGRSGKGLATIAGALIGGAGAGAAAASSNDAIGKCVAMILSQPEGVLIGVGGVLVAFGIGRKAGFAAGPKQP